MLEAYASETKSQGSEGSGQLSDAWEEVERKAPTAIAAGLKKLGPCAGASLDDDGIWKLAERDLFPSSDPVVLQARDVLSRGMIPLVSRLA